MMTRHIGSLYDPPDTVTRPLGSCTAMTSILGFRVALGGIVGAGVRPVYHDKPTYVGNLFRKFHIKILKSAGFGAIVANPTTSQIRLRAH